MQVIRSQVDDSSIGPRGYPVGSLGPSVLPKIVEPIIGLWAGVDGHPLGLRWPLLYLGWVGQSEEPVQVDHGLGRYLIIKEGFDVLVV